MIRRIEIGRAFVEAALKRDQANESLDKANQLLRDALALPPLPVQKKGPVVGCVRASEWSKRLDAGFHNPVARWIIQHLETSGHDVRRLDDPALTREIRAVTKFRKRVYVPKGGIPLLSSKQLF